MSEPLSEDQIDEILYALSETRASAPAEALAKADLHREQLTPELLDFLNDVLDEPDGVTDDEGNVFSYALYLFAKWREPKALPSVLRWLELPGDLQDEITGDVAPQDGSVILASVAGGDCPEIRALVENREIDEFIRGTALDALGTLMLWGELARENLVAYFRELIGEKLEHETNFIWGQMASVVPDLGLTELIPLLREPLDAGWVPEGITTWEMIENPREDLQQQYRDTHQPITDIAARTAWWARGKDGSPPEPIRAPAKPGRNDQCPCGSGKKYKKCCGKAA